MPKTGDSEASHWHSGMRTGGIRQTGRMSERHCCQIPERPHGARVRMQSPDGVSLHIESWVSVLDNECWALACGVRIAKQCREVSGFLGVPASCFEFAGALLMLWSPKWAIWP